MNALIDVSNPATIRAYFEKVRELHKSGEAFPVDLDEVWPLLYARKEKAVQVLRDNYIEDQDFRFLPQNGKQKGRGGSNKQVYKLSVDCFEHFVARKIKPVFDVYRQIFHQTVDQIEAAQSQIPGLVEHTKRPKQIQNSKEVNAFNFGHGGKEEAIDYNRKNCFLHTGMTPGEVVKWAKQKGVPSKHRSSAKEVMRYVRPDVASSMSLADEFCKTGKMEIDEAAPLCKQHALPLFSKMKEVGILPGQQQQLKQ